MAAVQDPVIPIVGELVLSNPGTISLGQGVVHYPPPPQAVEAAVRSIADPENHKYKSVQGIPELREALLKKLASENSIPAGGQNSLFVTAGGNLAFVDALLAITEPGDEIILMSPYYFNFEMAAAISGCRAVIVPTTEACQLDLERIADAVTPRTKAIVTISPNNPTGAVYPEDDLRAVNELCAARGLYHINDEVYEYFVYGGARHYSPGSAPGASDHTISLFSFSKAYGLAGSRIGYMTVPPQLELSIKKVQDTLLVCPPVVSQWAALGALEAGRGYCREFIAKYERVREQLYSELEAISHCCTAPRADGAFYVMLRPASDLQPMEFVQRLVKEHGVAVVPGDAFGARGCTLRVSYGALPAEQAGEGIERLVQGIAAICGRQQHSLRG